ncbi:MAG: hypothetical protein ACLTQI_05910 [Slackia sp.]
MAASAQVRTGATISEQDCYGWARMAQVVGNFFGGSLSVGIERYRTLATRRQRRYVIDGWK